MSNKQTNKHDFAHKQTNKQTNNKLKICFIGFEVNINIVEIDFVHQLREAGEALEQRAAVVVAHVAHEQPSSTTILAHD